MTTEEYQEQLFSFLGEYADFLMRMAEDENEKLQALLSNLLPRIEHAIAAAQANAKQMENLEIKRLRLQAQAGFEGMSFSEMIEASPEEERQGLESLFSHITHAIEDIKFHNTKSMGVARTHMLEINPSAAAGSAPGGGTVSDAYTKNREKTQQEKSTLLETKI